LLSPIQTYGSAILTGLAPKRLRRAIAEIKVAIEIAMDTARDRTITTRDAGSELMEQMAAADDPSSGLPGKLAVELARDTERNFLPV
jgi:hypothetical protein